MSLLIHNFNRIFFVVLLMLQSTICGWIRLDRGKKFIRDNAITINYTGNMGILISSLNTSVLVDGLHEYYGPDYLNPPVVEVNKILGRQAPYANLNLALFTHYHRDHYSAKLARDFLRSSSGRYVAGSQKVIDSLAAAQVINAWNRNGLLFKDSASELSIYSFDLPHTGPQRHSKVQNIAYLVKFGKSGLLHIGDANVDLSSFKKLHVGMVDVMVVPVWFLMDKEGKEIIDHIKPHTVIATHISPVRQNDVSKYKLSGIKTYFFTVINQAVIIKR